MVVKSTKKIVSFNDAYPKIGDKTAFLKQFNLLNLQKAGKIGKISSKKMQNKQEAIKAIMAFDTKNKFLICKTMFNNPTEYVKEALEDAQVLKTAELDEYQLNQMKTEEWSKFKDEISQEINVYKEQVSKGDVVISENNFENEAHFEDKPINLDDFSDELLASTNTIDLKAKLDDSPLTDDLTIAIDTSNLGTTNNSYHEYNNDINYNNNYYNFNSLSSDNSQNDNNKSSNNENNSSNKSNEGKNINFHFHFNLTRTPKKDNIEIKNVESLEEEKKVLDDLLLKAKQQITSKPLLDSSNNINNHVCCEHARKEVQSNIDVKKEDVNKSVNVKVNQKHNCSLLNNEEYFRTMQEARIQSEKINKFLKEYDEWKENMAKEEEEEIFKKYLAYKYKMKNRDSERELRLKRLIRDYEEIRRKSKQVKKMSKTAETMKVYNVRLNPRPYYGYRNTSIAQQQSAKQQKFVPFAPVKNLVN